MMGLTNFGVGLTRNTARPISLTSPQKKLRFTYEYANIHPQIINTLVIDTKGFYTELPIHQMQLDNACLKTHLQLSERNEAWFTWSNWLLCWLLTDGGWGADAWAASLTRPGCLTCQNESISNWTLFTMTTMLWVTSAILSSPSHLDWCLPKAWKLPSDWGRWKM